MNPWEQTAINRCKSIVRFGLWFALTLHAAMLAIFSILFTFQFLRHLWNWCERVLFQSHW